MEGGYECHALALHTPARHEDRGAQESKSREGVHPEKETARVPQHPGPCTDTGNKIQHHCDSALCISLLLSIVDSAFKFITSK